MDGERAVEGTVPPGRFHTLLSYLHFFWAGVAKQGQTGAIVPSQRFLIAKMIEPVPQNYRGQILELGCGTGALTLSLAARCPAARVLACELNPVLAQHTRRRLTMAGLHRRTEVVNMPAEQLMEELRSRGSFADFILSGIPLGNFSREKVMTLINGIHQTLVKGGLYIQYQHSLLDRKKIRSRFATLRISPVLFNFPPAVVYYARR